MVSAPREREDARSPWAPFPATRGQPQSPSPRSPQIPYSDSDLLCPRPELPRSARCLRISETRQSTSGSQGYTGKAQSLPGFTQSQVW